jgi:hypothetical protein
VADGVEYGKEDETPGEEDATPLAALEAAKARLAESQAK